MNAAYQEYLQTDRWAELRAYALQRDGYACRLCNGRWGLQVHHRRYAERWGMETVNDLTTLCNKCHERYSNPPTTLSFGVAMILFGLGFLAAVVFRGMVP